MPKGETVIAVLNRLVDFIEEHLTEEIDIAGLASEPRHDGVPPAPDVLVAGGHAAVGVHPATPHDGRRGRRARRRRAAGDRGPLRIRLDRGVRPSVPIGARRQPRRRPPTRRPPSHTTTAQVPPDRRREHHHGHSHRRSTGFPARRPLRSRAAHPPGRQSAHPGAHRLAARGRARSPEGAERHRAGRAASGERRRRSRLHGGQRADLPPRRRRRPRRRRSPKTST